MFPSFLLSSNPHEGRKLTSAHGAVAEGAVGEALGAVRWRVLVLLVTP